MTSTHPTLFPALLPSQIDEPWFPSVDSVAIESSLQQAEELYERWKLSVGKDADGGHPYGKSNEDQAEREGHYLSGSDNTSEEDLDTDVLDDQDSLQDADVDANSINNNEMDLL